MATASQLSHPSHKHPLILIDDFDSSSNAATKRLSDPLIDDDDVKRFLKCRICETPIIGLCPAYACSRDCSFFLHKRCAEESPKIIKHFSHPQHLLHLRYCEPKSLLKASNCAACTREMDGYYMWVYYCESFCKSDWRANKGFRANFVLCTRCVVMESVLDHEGHEQHSLTLLQRKACFSCDACGIESAEFDSYICHTCHFWIHGSCASYPRTIKLRIHEDDTLQLIYSIPDMYRRFTRHCAICRQGLHPKNWAYYCEESGYFVHINCAAKLLASGKNVIKTDEDGDEQTYSDLMQFPLPRTGSLTENLIAAHQSGNLTERNPIEDEVDINDEESPVINHWSHPQHKLFLLEELKNADNSDDDDDDDDDESDTNNRIDEMLVCDGCVQPISTASNKHYYGCIGCNFFLHSTCANHLPMQSRQGKCVLDPEHILNLTCFDSPVANNTCKVCDAPTSGFAYYCSTCPDKASICSSCSLAPHKIKHKCHKHPLVQRSVVQQFLPSLKKTCNACLEKIWSKFEYGCESCSNIHIHQSCAMSFPKMMFHRWDSHSLSLIYPPIYYKGLRYCEICELEVNPEGWLYRCSQCDQYFHPLCIRQPHHVKLGILSDPVFLSIHPHPLTLKMIIYKNRYPKRLQRAVSCRERDCVGVKLVEQHQLLYVECAGCNYITCVLCFVRDKGTSYEELEGEEESEEEDV